MAQNPPKTALDPVLHQPVRTRIAAYLAARGETTFTELKQALQITDGNLEAHIKKLVASGYVKTIKKAGEGRPQTLYRMTQKGNNAFTRYIDTLQSLLPLS
jgi:predicted ArsR family transcriptional regulator